MKMEKNNKAASTRSALLYDRSFQLAFLKPAYWGTWLGVFCLLLISLLPMRLQDLLANKLGDLARNISKKRRRIGRKNIDLCFPQMPDEDKKELLRQTFRHLIRSVLSYGLIWWGSKSKLEKRIVIKGRENIQQSLGKGRSVIVMAAHSLGLEAAVSAASLNFPISGPFRPMKNKLIDWFVANGRARHGTLLYTRDAGLRPIIKDVKAGCVMFYLPDEDLGKDRCIFVPFYGVQKASVPILGRLSKTCKADVIPCMSCYDEDSHQYIIYFLPAIDQLEAKDDYDDTRIMNASLEEIIQICPAQYFWTMKLFKTRPEGEKRFY